MDDITSIEAHLEDPNFVTLLSGKIEELRKRLIDGSRRNPLINVPFRANSRTLLRFVDELPDVLRYRLAVGQEMLLTSLPALEEPLPDEQTDAFLEALAAARYEDDVYREDMETIDPNSENADDLASRAERELKDRVRVALGLPVRQTKDKPSLATHARAHGVRPDYLLPLPEEVHDDGRHEDDSIQTLLLPDNLRRTAKSLAERARSYERETGVNVLQTVFGLLEWQPPGEAKPFVSPIAQLEAKIIRRQSPSAARFYVIGEGELTRNTSLALKLEIEYGLELPEYDGGDIEIYFEDVADCAPSGWKWNVRREAAVGIFPSSKIAMYHDLHTEKTNVVKSPLVAKLLGTTASGIAGYAKNYPPDDPAIAKKVPHLVLDADASQFSAMVDVANGASLAIEGPPGSGKSQTIVNIIASALGDGKKVLFVAEKLTALDVVKNRLESVGLGEFILPLQAGRSTSERVYEGLDVRLDAVAAPHQTDGVFESRRRHLEQERSKLQSYLDVLSSSFEGSGMTVHEVLGRAIATADARRDLPRHLRRNLVLRPMTGDEIEIKLELVKIFEDRLTRLKDTSPIWRDVRKIITSVDDADDLAEIANDVLLAIEDFERKFDGSLLSPCLSATTPIEEIFKGFTAMQGLAGDQYDPADLEPLLDSTSRKDVMQLVDKLKALQGIKGRLVRHLKSPDAEGIDRRLRKAVEFARNEGGGQLAPAVHDQEATQARSILAEAEPLYNEIASLPSIIWRDGAQPLTILRDQLMELFEHPEEARVSGQGLPRDMYNFAQALKKRAMGLRSRLSRVQSNLPGLEESWTSITRLDELIRTADVLDGTSVFGRIGGTYKAARNFYEQVLGGSKDVHRNQRATEMRLAASLLEEIKDFTDDWKASKIFGILFDGLATDFEKIRAATLASDTMQKLAEGSSETVAALATLKKSQFVKLLSDSPNGFLEPLYEQTPSELSDFVKNMSEKAETGKRRATDAAIHQELFLQLGDRDTLDLPYLEGLLEDLAHSSILSETIDVSEAWSRLPGLSATTGTSGHLVEERLAAAETLELLDDGMHALKLLETHGYAATLASLEAITTSTQKVVQCAGELAEALEMEPYSDVWAVQERKDAYRLASSSPTELLECGRLVRAEAELRETGLDAFAQWFRKAWPEMPNRPATELARAAIAKAMADKAVSEHRSVLEGYSGEDLDRIRETIAQLDRELVKLSRDVVRNTLLSSAHPPAGNGIGRKSTFTNMALINNERTKKKRRIGVRELTRRAGRALVELKPCWMMSPLAVAQYLHSGLSFDLLVVDEASQMTPENAIGALRRVKQAVVVGDTKQLPPTMFFNKIMQGEDIDEDFHEDSESILDLANAAFSPIRQLRWHYRSRHSGLIRFSNHWMYDDTLTIFPAADEDNPRLGVSLRKVDGFYQSRTNLIEAEAVVHAVVQHMTHERDLSLGVCTMNTDQKDLILEEFERERDRNSAGAGLYFYMGGKTGRSRRVLCKESGDHSGRRA
ncbi:MAG: DUF4011 domain-containing protein [Aestuariivita sp.]|nr:DUF4011 domain-containing protein [Aestuariivita sp.]